MWRTWTCDGHLDGSGHPLPSTVHRRPDDVGWSLRPIRGQRLSRPDCMSGPLKRPRPYIDMPATFGCTTWGRRRSRACWRGPLGPCHSVGNLCRMLPRPDSSTSNPSLVLCVCPKSRQTVVPRSFATYQLNDNRKTNCFLHGAIVFFNLLCLRFTVTLAYTLAILFPKSVCNHLSILLTFVQLHCMRWRKNWSFISHHCIW